MPGGTCIWTIWTTTRFNDIGDMLFCWISMDLPHSAYPNMKFQNDPKSLNLTAKFVS